MTDTQDTGHNIMKRQFPGILFLMLALTACSPTGFNCKYWLFSSTTNEPSNYYRMSVCSWRLTHRSWYEETKDPDTVLIQLANDLLHSEAALKGCRVDKKERIRSDGAGSLIFIVYCKDGGPGKNAKTRWHTRYTH